MAPRVGRRGTGDQEVAGSTSGPSEAVLRLGASCLYLHAPVTKQYHLVPASMGGVAPEAGKVTEGPASH